MTIHDFLKKWGSDGASRVLQSAIKAVSQGETLDADVITDLRFIAEDLSAALSSVSPQPARLDADRSATPRSELVGHFDTEAGHCFGPLDAHSYTLRPKKGT